MTKSLAQNHTDTAVSGVTSLNLPISVLNYAADFRVKSDEPGEAIITNLTSPIDCPEQLRFCMSDVKDIYKSSGIDASLWAPSKRGVTILTQLTDVWTVTDSTDSSYRVDLPIEGHLVLKIPANELVTADMIKAFAGRVCSGLFNTGVIDSDRLKSMIRGSLLPKDL